MKRILWSFQVVGIVMASLPLAFLPARAGELFGVVLYHVWRSRRRIAIDNFMMSAVAAFQACSSPQSAEKIIKQSFRNLGRFFVEITKIYYGRGKRILRETAIAGWDNFERAKAKGKGVIFVTGHCGNWELLAIASAFKGLPISVVARPLNNPYINMLLEKARSRYGNRIIYKRGALRGMLSVLKSGGCVGILMDQAVLPDEGYVIDFLGRGAWTTKVPALIAGRTGAPVLPAFIRRTGKGHEITIYPEVKLSSDSDGKDALRDDTMKFSRFIEDYIKENPSEWLWLHRRWKRAPEGIRSLEASLAEGGR